MRVERVALAAIVVGLCSQPVHAQPSMVAGGIIRDAGMTYTFSRETQGKVAFIDGTWWGVFGGSSGVDFYRFDKASGTWSAPSFPGSHVTSDAYSRADVHWDGTYLHVLYGAGMSAGKGALWLDVFTYSGGSFAVVPGFPALVVASGAVDKNWSITEDTTGRLWMSYQTLSVYGVVSSRGTDASGWSAFNAPIFMGNASTGIDNDLGSHGIVAFGGKIGLMWTECFSPPNNHTKFRWRSDANPDVSANAWGAVELCQEDATNDKLTDDHVCVRSFEGQVWCASKTEYSNSDSGLPRFTLMRRDVNGNWSHWTIKTINPVPDYSTRPVIAIDAANRKIYCLWHNLGVQYNTTSIDNPGTFSSIQTMILEKSDACWDTGVAQAPCDATTGLMVIADRNTDGWTMYRYLSLGAPVTGPLASITVTPNPATVATGGTVQFTATGRDANGNVVSFTPTWTATGGSITSSGLYTAGGSAGTFSVTASSGSVSGSATVNVTATQQTLTSITVTPNPASTTTGGTVQFSAQAKDQNGTVMSGVPFTWSATGGTISSSGLYTAGSTAGTFSVTATSGSVSGSATVTVSAAPPQSETIIDNDTAGFAIVSGTWGLHYSPLRYGPTNRTLDAGSGSCRWSSALAAGTYDVYAWWPSRGSSTNARATYTVHATSGDVAIAVDQTISSTWGVWNKLGTFALDATASVAVGASTGQNVAADAVRFVLTSGGGGTPPTLTTITVSPNPASVQEGATQPFTAQGNDQNGQPMDVRVAWSATGGTIDATGLYTAGNTAGQFSVTATSGNVSGSATVNVAAPQSQQVLTSITVSPNPAATTPNGTVTFTATARDQNGTPMATQPTFMWAATAGAIDQSGHYTAPSTTGSFDVSASSQGITGHATVNVTAPSAEVIVDNDTPGWSVISGTWEKHFNPLRYGPDDRLVADNTSGVCQWKPPLGTGTYDVYVWVPSRYGHAAQAVYTVVTSNGSVNVNLDQGLSSTWGVWTKLGTFSLDGSTASVQLTANAGQSVAADAVRFVQTGP